METNHCGFRRVRPFPTTPPTPRCISAGAATYCVLWPAVVEQHDLGSGKTGCSRHPHSTCSPLGAAQVGGPASLGDIRQNHLLSGQVKAQEVFLRVGSSIRHYCCHTRTTTVQRVRKTSLSVEKMLPFSTKPIYIFTPIIKRCATVSMKSDCER